MHNVTWVGALIACGLGALLILFTLSSGESAQQQIAYALVALCCAAIPYYFARAIDELAIR